jgi:hypothetical protein
LSFGAALSNKSLHLESLAHLSGILSGTRPATKSETRHLIAEFKSNQERFSLSAMSVLQCTLTGYEINVYRVSSYHSMFYGFYRVVLIHQNLCRNAKLYCIVACQAVSHASRKGQSFGGFTTHYTLH